MPEINGMIRAANALHYWERRQEIAAHNLANSETPGFKAERVFGRVMVDSIPVADTATDRSAGALTHTGEPLDLAIADASFLVISTPEGERLTRGGSFTLDAEGRLVDFSGNAVLGEGGEIILPPGAIEIDRSGAIRVEGAEVARLRMELVPEGASLVQVAGNLFLPADERVEQPLEDRQLRQGALEASNVDSIGSLVDLIAIQRNFAAVQRAVVTLDGIRGTAANELGRPV